MRRCKLFALLPLFLLSCRGDNVAAPQLRRPIEDLPAGATALVLTSDLRNTWQRAEGHDLRAVLERLGPFQKFLAEPGVARVRTAWTEVQARSGIDLEQDLLLNFLGNRAGLGFYRRADGQEPRDALLLVGELADADRFRRALDSLCAQSAASGLQCVESSVGGRPAIRLRDPNAPGFVIVQEGNFAVLSTADTLAMQALAIHGGSGSGSALGDPDFRAALGSLQPHNLMALERTGRASAPWMAVGFTWDPTGMHFEQMRPAAGSDSSRTALRREDILRSLPDGSAVACYMRPADLGLRELMEQFTARGAVRSDSSGAAGTRSLNPLASYVPAKLDAILGGEWGLVIQGLTPTAVAPVPEVGLVCTLRDPAAAKSALAFLEASLGAVRLHGKGYQFEPVSYGGRTFRSLVQPLSEAVTPSYLVDEDLAIVTVSRPLMQQIIDTRRSGRRSVETDRAFRRLREWVPEDASLVAYGDPQRLDRALAQLEPWLGRWNEQVQRTVQEVRSITPLGTHFPAGAVYARRENDRIALRGWLLEGS